VPALPFGTVNTPASVMMPSLADQLTALLLALLTRAANWTMAPGATVRFSGESLMDAVSDFAAKWDATGAIADPHPTVANTGREMIPTKAAVCQSEMKRKTGGTLKPKESVISTSKREF
jgi:hypothetical protein